MIRRWKMLRLLVGLLGITGAIVATGLLIGGGTLLWIDATMTDTDGFINTKPVTLETETYAIATPPAEIDITSTGPFEFGTLATFRIEVENLDSTKGVFVGVSEADALENYLGGVWHVEIKDLQLEPFKATMTLNPGELAPQTPSLQAFWKTSAQGVGAQTLTWDMESGDYSIILMNEDASPGVAVAAIVGARVPLIRPVSMSLLIGGGIVLALGTALLAAAL
jgi:hypothetical protein